MKLFAQMLVCVFVGLSIGSAVSWQRYRSELVEVKVVRVVKTRDESTIRFANNSLPHTVVEYRYMRQWAVPGIAGDIGEVIYELPPNMP
jgi:hypothetical protein